MPGKEYASKMVKVNFTQGEMVDLGGRLAEQHQEFEDLEIQKSAASSDFTSRIKATRLAIAGSFRKIKDGFEMQRHDCLVEYDYNLSMVHYVFERNGLRTIVEQRNMTPAERQMGLEFKKRPFSGNNFETFMS